MAAKVAKAQGILFMLITQNKTKPLEQEGLGEDY